MPITIYNFLTVVLKLCNIIWRLDITKNFKLESNRGLACALTLASQPGLFNCNPKSYYERFSEKRHLTAKHLERQSVFIFKILRTYLILQVSWIRKKFAE